MFLEEEIKSKSIKSIGKRIKKRRKELGLNADELGAKIGRNRATVYKYENGSIKNPSYLTVVDLAVALDTTTDYLTGVTDDPIDHTDYEDWLSWCGLTIPDDFRKDIADKKERAKEYWNFLESQFPNKDYLKRYGSPKQKEIIEAKELSDHPLYSLDPFEELISVPIFSHIPNAEKLSETKPIRLETFSPSMIASDSFGVIAQDDSMEPEICNGDIVFFQEIPLIETGQIGAFSLNGEYYCKRFKQLTDGSRWLFSDNLKYDPIPIKETDKFKVLGVYTSRFTKSNFAAATPPQGDEIRY